MIKKISILLTLIIFFGIIKSFSQCSMYELPLSTRINNASAIIEGKVISKISFWNKEHTLIFTSNSIEVYKVFKGNKMGSHIQLITDGGLVEGNMQLVEPSLQLKVGEIGIYFVEPAPIQYLSNNSFASFAGSQGFIKYDLLNKTAVDPFKKYNSIEIELYKRFENETNHKHTVVKYFNINNSQNNANKSALLVPLISNFSPANISAGTASVLTINGTGFGSTQSTSVVKFASADDGGLSYIEPDPSQYISWNDSQIQVEVPSKTASSGTAGSGTIKVIVGSNTATSSSSLTVNYAQLNLINSNIVYQTDHVNNNSTGGYTWQMFTGFDANTPAKDAFTRALNTWRCGIYVNLEIGTTTSINTIANDNVNVVRFDIGAELPVGVLGRCTSYWTSCNTGVWYVDELDIVFDDASSWNFTTNPPSGSQSDFESVAVHELGHGNQLTHVINPNDIMHYSITLGTFMRLINADNINGGNDVMSRSIVDNSCGASHMIALTAGNCPLGFPTADFIASNTVGCSIPDTISFTDQSIGAPSAWAWDMDNNGSIDHTTQNPTHVYQTAGTYAVKLKVTNLNGTDSIIKTNYITIGSASLPFSENFELDAFPPLGWEISQSPVDLISWARDTLASGNGTSTACAYMNHFNYSNGDGEKDFLISKAISLANVLNPSLTFKVAYKNYPNPSNYDTLRVLVSNDCGATYGMLAAYTKGGPILATAGSSTNSFKPTTSSHWRTETVDLNLYIGSSVILKFESTNWHGNNLYIDDINISGLATTAPIADFVASDTTICAGQCINFTNQSLNSPSSLVWTFTGGTPASSTAVNPSNICYNTAGEYAVQLNATNIGGFSTKNKISYITVSALPAIPTITSSGNTLTASNGDTYQWKLNGSPISMAIAATHVVTVDGNYTVTITDLNGCSATSAIYVVSTTDLQTNMDEFLNVSIYPNPFSTSAIIKIQTTRAKQIPEMDFYLYDLLGKEVLILENIGIETELFKEKLSKGLYFYKVLHSQKLIANGKLVIQ